MNQAYWDEIESGSQSAYWYDSAVVHACEGAKVLPQIFLLWTKCGHDVPAGKAYILRHDEGTHDITCPKCLAAIECPCDADKAVDPTCAAQGECARLS